MEWLENDFGKYDEEKENKDRILNRKRHLTNWGINVNTYLHIEI